MMLEPSDDDQTGKRGEYVKFETLFGTNPSNAIIDNRQSRFAKQR